MLLFNKRWKGLRKYERYNLNTSHVTIQQMMIYIEELKIYNLNTSHVTIQLSRFEL